MAGNTHGKTFAVTTFGESHGGAVGAIIDGCPAGHPFPTEAIGRQLARRRPGQSRLTSARAEPDAFEVLSGVDPATSKTLGTPIALCVRNKDTKSHHYAELAKLYRPSHADYTYDAKYGLRFTAGGGRASARETVARVAAGALAEDLLRTLGVEIVAWVESVAELGSAGIDEGAVSRDDVDASIVRCPDLEAAANMEARIDEVRKAGDTIGGVIRCVARGVPLGWGEPVFDKLTADLAAAMMSLPATRGFEVGEGFAATALRGSSHNDPFEPDPSRRSGGDGIRTRTNHSGGIQGGISNGETIRIAVAFKPVATVFMPQDTVDQDGNPAVYKARGRHDPCVLPRAVPMVESMMALVLCDHWLRHRASRMQEPQL